MRAKVPVDFKDDIEQIKDTQSSLKWAEASYRQTMREPEVHKGGYWMTNDRDDPHTQWH